ncbi:MAG: tetratricopeptide repeat protein [Rhodospirillaceae bacterium]|nr:tetratricopeptide repeat protein [Rhodospirillaceae bacterium]
MRPDPRSDSVSASAKFIETYRAATAAHQAGRLAEAERGYKKLLAIDPHHAETLYLLGALHHQQGNADDAVRRLARCLQIEPGHLGAIDMLGAVHAARREYDQALAMFARVAAAQPASGKAAYNLGLALLKVGRRGEAIDAYRRAVALDSELADAQNGLAQALAQDGKADEAFGIVQDCIRRHPRFALARLTLCSILVGFARWDDCERAAREALALMPDSGDAAYFLATALRSQRRWDEAAPWYARAVAARPGHVEALDEFGGVLFELRRYADAEQVIRQAIAADPAAPNPHTNLGRVLQRDAGRADEALHHHDICLAARPDYADAHNNRSIALYVLNRLDEAEAASRRAIALKPHLAEAHSNLGNILQRKGDLDGALAAYRDAMALQPANPEARWNTALTLLALGQFAEGWAGFGVRWQCRDFPAVDRSLGLPPLAGLDRPEDGPVLVWGEQGVGDETLYGGMVPSLIERGFKVVLECDGRLAPLWRRGQPDLIVAGRGPGAADAIRAAGATRQIPVGGLGALVRRSETDFPRHRGYWRADAERAKGYRARLGQGAKRLVAVSWISKNEEFGAHKSAALVNWRAILTRPDCVFVNVQYGDTAAERAAAAAELGVTLAEIPELDLFNDLDGLAALLAACDLTITVSNTTAHIAGALGLPLCVLAPTGAGKLWYWFFNRTDTPWYPSARIFRQTVAGSWREPLAAAAAALAETSAS